MEFKSRPQVRTVPRRVTIQDFADRPLRSYGGPRPAQRVHSPQYGHVDSMLTGNRVVYTPPRQAAASSPIAIVKAQPYAKPAQSKLQQSKVLARRTVARSQPVNVAKVLPRTRSKMQVALVTMAVLVFGFGVMVNVQTLRTNHAAKLEVAALSKKTSQAAASSGAPNDDVVVPSEDVPPEVDTGRSSVRRASAPIIEPGVPKSLIISSLGVKAHVKPIGVTSKGELGVPYNIYETGWYDASARPGSGAGSGAVLIDGHVVGPTKPGIFASIKKMAAGDTIQVTRTDNKVVTYAVVKTQNYDANTLNVGMLLTSVTPGKPGLNLITCGGPFDTKTQHYTQRTVVFAVQQS